jgi:hypothetical protein
MTRQEVLYMAAQLRKVDLPLTQESLDLVANTLEALAPDGAEAIMGGRDGNKSYGTRCTCSFHEGRLVVVCPDHIRAINERVAEVQALREAARP